MDEYQVKTIKRLVNDIKDYQSDYFKEWISSIEDEELFQKLVDIRKEYFVFLRKKRKKLKQIQKIKKKKKEIAELENKTEKDIKSTKSGYEGVYVKDTGKRIFVASIYINGKHKSLGSFYTAKIAAAVYQDYKERFKPSNKKIKKKVNSEKEKLRKILKELESPTLSKNSKTKYKWVYKSTSRGVVSYQGRFDFDNDIYYTKRFKTPEEADEACKELREEAIFRCKLKLKFGSK